MLTVEDRTPKDRFDKELGHIKTDDHSLQAVLPLLEGEEEARLFLLDLATPAELKSLQDRWKVVLHLIKGLSYRQIHEVTGVSTATITRVARHLSHGSGGYKIMLEKIKDHSRSRGHQRV